MVILLSILLLLVVAACVYVLDRWYRTNKAFEEFKQFNTFTNVVPRRQYREIKSYLEAKKSIFSKKSRYEIQGMINTLLLLINDKNINSYVVLAFQSSLDDKTMTDTEHKKQAISYLNKLIDSEVLNKETFKEMIFHLFCIVNR